MQQAMEDRRLERLWHLESGIFEQDRFFLTESASLMDLAEAFPGESSHPDATHAIDLDRLNRMARPLGFLAAWEPEGLLVFRLRL